MRRPIYNSARAKRRQKALIIKTVFYSAVVLIGVLIAVGLFWLPFFRIKTIEIKDSYNKQEEISKLVSSSISGRMLGVFPKNNFLLIHQKRLQADIQSNSENVKSVELSKSLTNIKLTIIRYKPTALWCRNLTQGFENLNCFYLNEDGLLYGHAPSFTGRGVVKYGSGDLDNLSSGDHYLDSGEFLSLNSFVNSLKARNIFINKIIVRPGKDIEALSSSGWRLMLNLDSNLSNIPTYLAAMKNDESLAKYFDSADTFDYIDFRFQSRVFYKFKSELGAVETQL